MKKLFCPECQTPLEFLCAGEQGAEKYRCPRDGCYGVWVVWVPEERVRQLYSMREGDSFIAPEGTADFPRGSMSRPGDS